MTKEIELRHELWRRGDLSYKLDGLQLKIKETDNNARESLVLSSRQIGKSFEALVEAIEFCIKNPKTIVRFATDTYEHIQEIVEDNMVKIIEDAPPGMVIPMKSRGRWQIGQSSLRLGALERQYVDGNRGGNASFIILEEGGFVKSEDYRYAYESVFGPQLLRSKGRIKHITTVSEDEDHFIHTEILPKCELSKSVSRYTVYDSPSISDEQIKEAKRLCGGEASQAWRREYLAIIERNEETVIIPKFRKDHHVRKIERPEYCYWTLSVDFGGGRDFDAYSLLFYDYKRAKVSVYRNSIWPLGTNTKEIVADLKNLEEKLGICSWGEDRLTPTVHQEIWRFGDGPARILSDVSEVEKYHIVMPEKTNQPAAVNAVDIGFYQDEIEVDPSCEHLISSLQNGKYNKNRTDFERTKTLGHFDSGMSLVYGYRNINRKNPYPAIAVNPDTQVRIRPEKEISSQKAIADAFGKTRPLSMQQPRKVSL